LEQATRTLFLEAWHRSSSWVTQPGDGGRSGSQASFGEDGAMSDKKFNNKNNKTNIKSGKREILSFAERKLIKQIID